MVQWFCGKFSPWVFRYDTTSYVKYKLWYCYLTGNFLPGCCDTSLWFSAAVGNVQGFSGEFSPWVFRYDTTGYVIYKLWYSCLMGIFSPWVLLYKFLYYCQDMSSTVYSRFRATKVLNTIYGGLVQYAVKLTNRVRYNMLLFLGALGNVLPIHQYFTDYTNYVSIGLQ